MTSFVKTIGEGVHSLDRDHHGPTASGYLSLRLSPRESRCDHPFPRYKASPPNAYTPPPYSYDFKNLIFVISVVLLPYASEISVKFSRFRDFIV